MRWHIPTFWAAVFCLSSLVLSAQTRGRKSLGTLQQDSGTTWAMQAIQALTGGNPVHGVSESGTIELPSLASFTTTMQWTREVPHHAHSLYWRLLLLPVYTTIRGNSSRVTTRFLR